MFIVYIPGDFRYIIIFSQCLCFKDVFLCNLPAYYNNFADTKTESYTTYFFKFYNFFNDQHLLLFHIILKQNN